MINRIKYFLWRIGLTVLPKNLVSRLMGKVAKLRSPRFFVAWGIRDFARRFKIDLLEMQRPLVEFESLQDFFTRSLKAGSRIIDSDQNSVISPCDGFWGESGRVTDGALLQIKGKPYRMSSLLGDKDWALRFEAGSFATFYLSPKDYHRFHAPFDGEVVQATHLPGYLWPVSPKAVKSIDNLFCVNERIVSYVKVASEPDKYMALIAVGATMVGKVHVEFDLSLTTNLKNAIPTTKNYSAGLHGCKKGDLFGQFQFGSTVVLVFENGFMGLTAKEPGSPLKMGESIGRVFPI